MSECCAECGVPNGRWIIRSEVDGARYVLFDPTTAEHWTPNGTPIRLSEVPDEFAEPPHIKVVLVTQAATGKRLCQRCFLLTVNRKVLQHKPQPGQMEMFGELS